MISLLALMLLLPTPADGSQRAPSAENLIYADQGTNVRYVVSDSRVEFTSELPVGWQFVVSVDGDQNGQWGTGAHEDFDDLPATSHDFKYGQNSSGKLCTQYILSASPRRPEDFFVSTPCGRFKSEASISVGIPDPFGLQTVTLTIPAKELFGSFETAHVQVCVWNGQMSRCQHSPIDPYIVLKPASSTDEAEQSPAK